VSTPSDPFTTPSGPFTVIDSWSMSTVRVFSRTSTPISSSRFFVYSWSLGTNGGSTAPAPSSRMIRASCVFTER
jgi:hypothetical protein